MGWAATSVGEICLPVKRVSPGQAPNQPFTYLDIASIDNSLRRVVSPKTYLGKDAPSRARQKVLTGNTLFSTVRTYLRNIAVVPPEFDGQAASTGFCVLNPCREVDSKFVFYFVQNDDFVSKLNPIQRGTSYPAVRDADVLAQAIPLPEQHRIVAEIEKQFTRLETSVAGLRRAQANLKRYRASVLRDACEGSLVPTEAEFAPRAATTNPPASCWSAFSPNAAPAGIRRKSAGASTRSRPPQIRRTCRTCPRGGCGAASVNVLEFMSERLLAACPRNTSPQRTSSYLH